MLIYFLVLKTYWKILSETLQFHRYFPFQGFYQLFIKGSALTYIIYLESIDQFLSKAHIGNSDQDKIWFEPYCLFKDST